MQSRKDRTWAGREWQLPWGSSCGSEPVERRPTRHRVIRKRRIGRGVILIGLDGASWNVLDPMIEAGELPNLAALVERGTSARLATVEPVISPTVWTSIATGRSPEVHGIDNFFVTSEHLRWPTAWQRLSRKGLRVGLYNFLVTWPPMELAGGFVIPGWLRRDDSVTPPDVFERATVSERAIEPYSYELSIDSPQAVRDTVDQELSLKAPHFNTLRRTFDLDLGVVTFYSIDVISHRFWHDYRPQNFEGDVPPVEAQDRGILRRTVIRTDRAVGEIVDAAGPGHDDPAGVGPWFSRPRPGLSSMDVPRSVARSRRDRPGARRSRGPHPVATAPIVVRQGRRSRAGRATAPARGVLQQRQGRHGKKPPLHRLLSTCP